MEMLGYIFTLVMGVSLGLLGGGGSILTVPILIYLFKVNAVEATAYSLFIVGLASGFGAIGKMRDGLVNFKVGATFAVPGFLGVFVSRAYLIPSLPEKIYEFGSFEITKEVLIMLVFSIMMILASFSMIKGRKDRKSVQSGSHPQPMNFPLIAVEGLVVGALTGFVGAGGGFLIIPALVVLAKLPMKMAVGTSLVIISFKSLLGFIGDVMVNPNIQWTFLIALSVISVVGIFIGSHFSKKVPEATLKKGFGYFVLVMGAFILYQQVVS
ncbi:sulfite exporter TauE/SafE family protein [bacterium]|nr:sulfite exporter TauE/SafE family protein [bacterium]